MRRYAQPASAPEAGAAGAITGDASAFFEPWADWLQQHLLATFPQLHEQALPSRFSASGEPPGATIGTRVFSGDFAEGSPIRRFRVTLVSDGARLQAMNAAVYPAYELGPVPIFGADLLSFNSHQRLLFGVDWAPMAPDDAYVEANIAPYVADLRWGPKGMELAGDPSGKFYGERPEFFSPHMFFARPQGAPALEPEGQLWQVFCEYTSQYVAMLENAKTKAPVASTASSVAERRQADFNRWHAERDPAIPIFKRMFGGDWTEEFAGTILFPCGSTSGQ